MRNPPRPAVKEGEDATLFLNTAKMSPFSDTVGAADSPTSGWYAPCPMHHGC